MAIPDLVVTENYDALKILRESQLNTAMTSIETHINTNIKLNIIQFALDVFGVYAFDNDGLANRVTPLLDAAAILADNETITGTWAFSNGFSAAGAITSTSTFTSSGQPRARAYLTAANQVIADSTQTAINCNAETYDVAAMHDNGVNPNRLTVPAGGSGSYSIHGQITFAASNVGRRELYIFKNGSKIAEAKLFNPDAALQSVLHVECHDAAVATDYYELRVFQTSGGNLDVVLGERVSFFSTMKVW